MNPNRSFAYLIIFIALHAFTGCSNNDHKVAESTNNKTAVKDSISADNASKRKAVFPVLERGRPINLDSIDFEHTNLDSLFAKLAYLKTFNMDGEEVKNTDNKPLVIKRCALYNIPDLEIAFRYASKGSVVIKPGQTYGDTLTIDRSVPLTGLKDPDLRLLGYWGHSGIVFNKIFTTSTKKDELVRILLQSDELPGITEKSFQRLVHLLGARYNSITPKLSPQDNDTPNSYEWSTKTENIKISFTRDGALAYITLLLEYLNRDRASLPKFNK